MVIGATASRDCARVFLKLIKSSALQPENQTGLGAKLSGAERHGIFQAFRDFCTALLQRPGQNENRIQTAHLGENRNRLRA